MQKWYKIPEILRFLFVGIFNASFSYCVFCILVYFFGEQNAQICLAVQWVMTSFITFSTQKFFVFQSKGNIIKEYLKCCASWAVSYIINAVILELLINSGLNVYIAQFTALGIASCCTFIMLKYWALIRKNK